MQTITKPADDLRERVSILSKKDLEFSYFCGPGKGGQAKNKIRSGCMIRHAESGATGRASDSRSLDENKQSAFLRLIKDPRMKFWLAKQIYEIQQQETVEQTVAREMADNNLRCEIQVDGKWKEVPASYFETAEAKTEH